MAGVNVIPTCGAPGEEYIDFPVTTDWTPLFSVNQQLGGSESAIGVAYITNNSGSDLFVSRYPEGPGGRQLSGGTIAWPYFGNLWVKAGGDIAIDVNSYTSVFLDPKLIPTGGAPTS